jgi:hypothetical protein
MGFKVFDMGFLLFAIRSLLFKADVRLGLSFPRNAQNVLGTKTQVEKNSGQGGGWVWDLANARGSPSRGTKKRTPTWLVGSSEAKKVPKLVSFFPRFFYRVFEPPSPKNAQRRD